MLCQNLKTTNTLNSDTNAPIEEQTYALPISLKLQTQ